MFRQQTAQTFDQFTVADGIATVRRGDVDAGDMMVFAVDDMRCMTLMRGSGAEVVTVLIDGGLEVSLTGVGNTTARQLFNALRNEWKTPP